MEREERGLEIQMLKLILRQAETKGEGRGLVPSPGIPAILARLHELRNAGCVALEKSLHVSGVHQAVRQTILRAASFG